MSTPNDTPARFVPRDAEMREAMMEICVEVASRAVNDFAKYGSCNYEHITNRIVPKVPPKLRIVPVVGDASSRSMGVAQIGEGKKPWLFDLYTSPPQRKSLNSPYSLAQLADMREDAFAMTRTACALQAAPYETDEPLPPTPPRVLRASDVDAHTFRPLSSENVMQKLVRKAINRGIEIERATSHSLERNDIFQMQIERSIDDLLLGAETGRVERELSDRGILVVEDALIAMTRSERALTKCGEWLSDEALCEIVKKEADLIAREAKALKELLDAAIHGGPLPTTREVEG